MTEYDIPVNIGKPLDIKSLDTTGPSVRVEPPPSPEEMQVKYATTGIKVRDYAYAGRVISPVVPKTAIPANCMQAYAYASAKIDPTTRKPIPSEEVVYPSPATPEIFDPYWAMAVYLFIMHEREVERERALGNTKSKYLSGLTLPIKACDVPIPARILHRLVGVAKWLTEEDMKNWLPVDWLSLNAYLDSGAEAAQPCLIRRMAKRQLPSWEDQRASISRNLEGAWKKTPPSPRTLAAADQIPCNRRSGSGSTSTNSRSPSECVRIIAHKEFSSTSEPVESSPRSVYLEGVTGEYADGVGDSIPGPDERLAIFQTRSGTACAFWNCLRRSWAAKRGIAVPAKKLGKVKRLIEQKPAPQLKRGIEDDGALEDRPQMKKSRRL
ncbi:hypothetical protein BT96DRAFT_933670 [Gymnopus androsaceus JB14]|uniref:Uncharacterized protein n=1 Tax=Gymnopus androsaceus JB14 TaxID=1447944 RepID=A0A6A4IE13_9AGAR|nr:hypothetical protein BT96DRAFT_933670 [Gymnopus androsaceus JB14]